MELKVLKKFLMGVTNNQGHKMSQNKAEPFETDYAKLIW